MIKKTALNSEKLREYCVVIQCLGYQIFPSLIVQTDASNAGIGAVLSQVVNDEEHPVMYLNRKLLPREVRYAVVEKECLVGRRNPKIRPIGKRIHVSHRSFTIEVDERKERKKRRSN